MSCNCGQKQGIHYNERPKVKIIKKKITHNAEEKIENLNEERV